MYFGTGISCQLYMCVFPFVQGSEFMLKEGVTEPRWRVSHLSEEWSSWRDEARIPAGGFYGLGNPCLCRVCGFLPLEVISIGVFHVGTPVCSAARDPWRGLALACILHGSCSSLERAFWLFCEMYTRAFGVSLVYYSVHLQCILVFLFKGQIERAGGFHI